jgi:hypothetical protein
LSRCAAQIHLGRAEEPHAAAEQPRRYVQHHLADLRELTKRPRVGRLKLTGGGGPLSRLTHL